jgi:uncharacterized protein
VLWLNEPARWSQDGTVLTVTADPKTDFWRTTGYGFVHDNGHVYGEQLADDFTLSVRVRGAYAGQYDHAGVMVRIDEQRWLKTGIEFFNGRMRFSTVHTAEFSSWAVGELPDGLTELSLRVTRRGDAVEVHYAADDAELELGALVYLPPGETVLAGPMCAAPEGPGFEVTFSDLVIQPGLATE